MIDDPTQHDRVGDRIAGRICRVVNCRRARLADTLYCSDHLQAAWYHSFQLKTRYPDGYGYNGRIAAHNKGT